MSVSDTQPQVQSVSSEPLVNSTSSSSSTSPNPNSNTSSLNDLQEKINEVVKSQLNSFFKINVTSDIKDKHYSELEQFQIKYQKASNSQKVNQAYLDNKVFPKSLALENFPEPMFKHDDGYVESYFNLINNVRKEIIQHNI